MPKREDLRSILIIGAGPIVIGQACEFDYSGAQACKALKDEGYRVILVNSNPATIMTDPETADVTYIEPITWQVIERIIAKEKPDAILPTMGGQTALNCAMDLYNNGVLNKYRVELIGASPDAIAKAEDRLKFKDAMTRIGLSSARSDVAHTMAEALSIQEKNGFPVVIRPSFTLGGTGGGIAYNLEEFAAICQRGFDLSPTHELLIEESLIGWKEFEMEVVRDKADNCIIVCSIENLDPMGVHTGDSITVAPAQTLTDKEYQRMRDASIAVLRQVGVECGGSNVLFLPRLPVVQQPALALRWMGAQAFLVGFGAPARAVRHDKMAVDDLGHMREQFMVPRQAVDVGFHDAQVRHGGREMRVLHGAEMAVEIMRGDVDLEMFGGSRNLHRLPYPVPGRVDDGDVHRLLVEVGQELAQAQQRLAG